MTSRGFRDRLRVEIPYEVKAFIGRQRPPNWRIVTDALCGYFDLPERPTEAERAECMEALAQRGALCKAPVGRSREGRESLHVEIPTELKAVIDELTAPNWYVITEAAKAHYELEEETMQSLDREIEAEQRRQAALQEEIAALKADLKASREQEADLREQREACADQQATYTDILDDVLDAMEADGGTQVIAYTTELEAAARLEYGRATDDTIDAVITDLRERARETGRAIQAYRFRRMPPAAAQQAAADGGQSKEDQVRAKLLRATPGANAGTGTGSGGEP